jgi:hypothetical protein
MTIHVFDVDECKARHKLFVNCALRVVAKHEILMHLFQFGLNDELTITSGLRQSHLYIDTNAMRSGYCSVGRNIEVDLLDAPTGGVGSCCRPLQHQ